jgi:prefoldin alpha subunit
MELRMMEGTLETYQQRSQILSAALSNLRMAERSLKDLKKVESNTPLLVPVGGDAFVHAQLGLMEKVIVNVGANVSIEMELDEAITDIEERLSEIEKNYQVIQSQLAQVLNQMHLHEQRANRLSAELQGEAVGV